ncbi:MAG: hypothetical protein CVU57_12490 [Deltaproteobacteria bacterium HGW-Deltaproteobacteria-15]|jgi:hypothetical protein|nr:MAG: hypothetical protein CVU57_12490 [Deltaproteobacteria bacterium HGW-Deltaproteobacteria-15]
MQPWAAVFSEVGGQRTEVSRQGEKKVPQLQFQMVARANLFVRAQEKSKMIWLMLLVVGIWLLLQLYILPKMGVST